MRHWRRRGLLAWLLWPASLVFGLLVLLRRLFTRGRRAGVPVIVVGNLTVGGSGKTPLVLWIAEFLKKHGWSPAIVSRGYGGKMRSPKAVTLISEPSEVGADPHRAAAASPAR